MNQVTDPRETDPTTEPPQEMTMNTFVSTLYRDLTCAAAAALISVIAAMSFVQSTAVARGVAASTTVSQPSHQA